MVTSVGRTQGRHSASKSGRGYGGGSLHSEVPELEPGKGLGRNPQIVAVGGQKCSDNVLAILLLCTADKHPYSPSSKNNRL